MVMACVSDNQPSKFLAHLTGRIGYFIKVPSTYLARYYPITQIYHLDREYHENYVQSRCFQRFISDAMEH